MKQLIAIMLCAILLFSAAFAESPDNAESYVLSMGFVIADVDVYDGVPRCYMLEDADWQSVTFTTETQMFGVIALKEYDANYDPNKLRRLFYDLCEKFDYSIMYYWPEHDTAEKIALSYGITDSLDMTDFNTNDRDFFLKQLDYYLFEKQSYSDVSNSITDIMGPYYDSIYQSLGFDRNTVTAFMETHFGLPRTVSEFTTPGVNVCAQYAFFNDFAACRTGANNPNMLLYPYGQDAPVSISDSEIWGYFGMLKEYLEENGASIVLDGAIENADTLTVIIDIVTSANYDRIVYDIISDEFNFIDLD